MTTMMTAAAMMLNLHQSVGPKPEPNNNDNMTTMTTMILTAAMMMNLRFGLQFVVGPNPNPKPNNDNMTTMMTAAMMMNLQFVSTTPKPKNDNMKNRKLSLKVPVSV
jgi:hypothetical protein